jgi:hypothetical protein
MALEQIWFFDQRLTFAELADLTIANPTAGLLLQFLLRVTGPNMKRFVRVDADGYLALSNELLSRAFATRLHPKSKAGALKHLEARGLIDVVRSGNRAPKVRLTERVGGKGKSKAERRAMIETWLRSPEGLAEMAKIGHTPETYLASIDGGSNAPGH